MKKEIELTKDMEEELTNNKGNEPCEAKIKTRGSWFGIGKEEQDER